MKAYIYEIAMKKLLWVIFLIMAVTACTLRKVGGTWHVKKTIVDEVKETVQETKELASDLKDANSDLGDNNVNQEKSVQADQQADSSALRTSPSQDGIEPKKAVIQNESVPKKKRYKKIKSKK